MNKLVIRDVKEPIPGPGDVKIRVKASGICGTDLHILHGDFIATYPIIPGHEFSGEVVELGAEVTNVSVGDRMVIDPVIFCGRCLYCQTMESALRWLKSGAIRVDKLLSHQIGLEEFPQGLKLIGQPDTMKIQVVY